MGKRKVQIGATRRMLQCKVRQTHIMHVTARPWDALLGAVNHVSRHVEAEFCVDVGTGQAVTYAEEPEEERDGGAARTAHYGLRTVEDTSS